MKKLPWSASSSHLELFLAALAAFALVSILPGWQVVHAQAPAPAAAGSESPAQSHASGLALEHRGDEKGAFVAFLAAAEQGYPPAQRRLGEIYDSGNSAVERNYQESIRWYEKAREGGEELPPQRSYGGPFVAPIR